MGPSCLEMGGEMAVGVSGGLAVLVLIQVIYLFVRLLLFIDLFN